jgi:predicted TIM-barrel fold metal-dependent hydrolase
MFLSADLEKVNKYQKLANIKCSIVTPLSAFMPRGGGDAVASNVLNSNLIDGLSSFLFWVVINPMNQETFKQAEIMLKLPKCAGIKIHPEEHGYPIKEYGYKIFEFAQKHNAIIETHSGDPNSMPGDFVPFADEFPDVRVILSHLGCSFKGDSNGEQVMAIQKSKSVNLYTDTSSFQILFPNLLEWAVEEIGSNRILFGTDCPLYFPPMIRTRVDKADISDEDKERILYRNACKLFGSKLEQSVAVGG